MNLVFRNNICLEKKMSAATSEIIDLTQTDEDKADHLKTHGWITVKVLDKDELELFRKDLLEQIARSPEFNPGLPKTHKFAKTGFGTLGNASSFHNKVVRNLRKRAHEKVKPIFKKFVAKYANNRKMYLEQIVDRVMIRQNGQQATPEAWHRDQGAFALDDDFVFGGWLNLNSPDGVGNEYLSAVPGSQLPNNPRQGFAVFEDSEKDELRRRRALLTVPPGYMLVFYENMAHEVLAKPTKMALNCVCSPGSV